MSEKQPIHTYVGIIRFRFEGIISANKRLAPLDNLLKTMQKYKFSANQKTKTVPIIFFRGVELHRRNSVIRLFLMAFTKKRGFRILESPFLKNMVKCDSIIELS